MEGGKEQNYWPGFVDVLSNVVLTLVFVLVVFVLALSLSANKVEQQMKQIIKENEEIKSKKANEAKEQELACNKNSEDHLVQEKNNDNQDIKINIEKDPNAKNINNIELKITDSQGKIELYYPSSGINLDDKSSAKLEELLNNTKKKVGIYKILIYSYIGKEQYSLAQRLAYYRVLYLRKFLIDKAIATNDIIHSKISQADGQEGHIEIIFQSNK